MLRQATIDMDAMVTELAREVTKSTPAEHTMAARLMECRDVNTGKAFMQAHQLLHSFLIRLHATNQAACQEFMQYSGCLLLG